MFVVPVLPEELVLSEEVVLLKELALFVRGIYLTQPTPTCSVGGWLKIIHEH
jgi:hypothetical protein